MGHRGTRLFHAIVVAGAALGGASCRTPPFELDPDAGAPPDLVSAPSPPDMGCGDLGCRCGHDPIQCTCFACIA